ncbi:MAG: type II toxin-antitoxin system RelE/ParE family toxin, partial [Nitrospirae bacterium]|nr:type II toxin-antitoxin system RelE/ParE family toxin [Nitrospirota bacterium]
ELRVQNKQRIFRIFFAFDPDRSAILLIGGDKKGDSQFYQRMIPIADALLDKHLEKWRKEK